MVGERGFEPPTPWSRTRCSTRLSHSPNSLVDGTHHRARPGAFSRLMRSVKCSRTLGLVVLADGVSKIRDYGPDRLGFRCRCPELGHSSKRPPTKVGGRSFNTNSYWFCCAGAAGAFGKIPSIGARFFSSPAGSGSGLRGIIWSRIAAL
jgi:hypothetical protein